MATIARLTTNARNKDTTRRVRMPGSRAGLGRHEEVREADMANSQTQSLAGLPPHACPP